MKKYLYLCLLMISCATAARATSFVNETLNYVIQYKWGLVQKNAATAQLTLRNTAKDYNIMLTAKTLPWANSIYPVSDTLKSVINKSDFRPVSYTKITHEKGKYRKDLLTYSYVGNNAYGKCIRWKSGPGVPLRKTEVNCSATGPTYDMLSIFYYIRTLDYPTMLTGKVVKATIFSGSAPESIKIKCVGKENVKLPSGKTYSCYQLQFTFTTGGGTQSSAPMNAWVTTGPDHTPVKLVGTLAIGQVRCFLTSVG
ncbi:MAG: DUF3108 domain-containing protein [Bacteroidales bacterium]|nr:DUF3108 domain-containing protein [Bacteroidales bacterium]